MLWNQSLAAMRKNTALSEPFSEPLSSALLDPLKRKGSAKMAIGRSDETWLVGSRDLRKPSDWLFGRKGRKEREMLQLK